MILAVMNAIYAIAYIEAWKSQDFNRVLQQSDLVLPVRHSNQLNYEATDFGSKSFVGSSEPWGMNVEVMYEIFYMLNCGWEIK